MHPPLWHCVMMCWTSLTINSLFLSPSFLASSSGRSLKPTKPLLLQLLYFEGANQLLLIWNRRWRLIREGILATSDKSIRHKFLTLVCCRHWKQRLFPITGWSWTSAWLPTKAHSSVADGKAVRIQHNPWFSVFDGALSELQVQDSIHSSNESTKDAIHIKSDDNTARSNWRKLRGQ